MDRTPIDAAMDQSPDRLAEVEILIGLARAALDCPDRTVLAGLQAAITAHAALYLGALLEAIARNTGDLAVILDRIWAGLDGASGLS